MATIGQPQKINDYANELLDLVMRWNRGEDFALQIIENQVRKIKIGKGENVQWITEHKFKDPREIGPRGMQEIRERLKLQMEMCKTVYDLHSNWRVLNAPSQRTGSSWRMLGGPTSNSHSMVSALKSCSWGHTIPPNATLTRRKYCGSLNSEKTPLSRYGETSNRPILPFESSILSYVPSIASPCSFTMVLLI